MLHAEVSSAWSGVRLKSSPPLSEKLWAGNGSGGGGESIFFKGGSWEVDHAPVERPTPMSLCR